MKNENKEEEYQENELWKSKYRILILYNSENEEFIEDECIAILLEKMDI